MKKNFIDYLYDVRAGVQSDIDKLVRKQNLPFTDDQDKEKEEKFELIGLINSKRVHLGSVNLIIEEYFSTHSKPIS